MFVINFGDQFVLRQYRSLDEVGIYSLAYRIGMIVSIAYGSLAMYWSAQVYRVMRMQDAETVFARLFTYAILLLSSVTLVLVLCCKPGLRVLVAADFRAATPLIPVIAVANAIRGVGEFLRCRFLAQAGPATRRGATGGNGRLRGPVFSFDSPIWHVGRGHCHVADLCRDGRCLGGLDVPDEQL